MPLELHLLLKLPREILKHICEWLQTTFTSVSNPSIENLLVLQPLWDTQLLTALLTSLCPWPNTYLVIHQMPIPIPLQLTSSDWTTSMQSLPFLSSPAQFLFLQQVVWGFYLSARLCQHSHRIRTIQCRCLLQRIRLYHIPSSPLDRSCRHVQCWDDHVVRRHRLLLFSCAERSRSIRYGHNINGWIDCNHFLRLPIAWRRILQCYVP